ncbi:hypothetical protein N7520_008112 [Penicillium odoratum]|uniref:uncharacterized protein n=1 Tax=Penicillium odoratum TaxID=1167516 RepID=UPI002546F941|nr:uncharacterized protein N7520_008112 [Penicillium odoratum]KAJ5760956.1 hypothetical protein N7520_008112 [Penicillium odoratum]
MYAVLKEHHEEDSVLQRLWEELNSIPDWVDWTQIERGQEFFYRYLVPNLTGLALQGVLGGTATIAGGTEIFVRTGGFSLRVMPRRFLENFLWLSQVAMDLKSIQPGGAGHTSTVRVRLLHATVSRRILKLMNQNPTYFDEVEYRAPVNLRDVIHATAIFCCMPLFRQLPKIGIQPRPNETKDFLALFRYIAYVMATPNSYFDGVEQSKATMKSIMACEPEPTEASKSIGANFLTAVQDYPGINVSRSMTEIGCRTLSGDELTDKMGISRPDIFFCASFRGWCQLLVVVTSLQRCIPAFDRMMIKHLGDLLGGTWSIGGPQPSDPLEGILRTGQGLSYSHNNYEGDGSIGRNDAYTNHGDAHSLNISKFEAVYAVGGDDLSENGYDQRYTIDKFRARYAEVQADSIATNPYYFTGAFSTIVVVPAAYNFVINFMSNFSAEEPTGYLDGFTFKQFFGVSGSPGSFVWNKGQEIIPNNWYRRPSTAPYSLDDVVLDVGIGYLAYPDTLKIGGNTGSVNSFTGVEVSDLTGGVLDAGNLFEGDNFACFVFSLLQQGIPDFLKGPLADIFNATSFLDPFLAPILGKLECPELGQYDQSLFNHFPGYTYSPTGPDTNY